MDIKVKTVSTEPQWKIYELKNDKRMEVHLLNYGGKITKILTPNKFGEFENVVLSYENIEDYKDDFNFLGSLIGPVAGRINNAQFSVKDEVYHLEKNDGENTLHSGTQGFKNVIWKGRPFQKRDSVGVELEYNSVDGEFGFPGNKKVTVIYTLTNNNELMIDYQVETDKSTPIILTNHSYFNLSGKLNKSIEDHIVTFKSNQYAALDQKLIPTGELLDTKKTTFDFQEGKKLTEGIHSVSNQNTIVGGGFDHYFFFNDDDRRGTIVIREETGGRNLKIETNHPGMVMYTSNNLEGGLELDGGYSKKHLGVCFETQEFPGGINNEAFPNVVLNPKQNYHRWTKYSFGTIG